MKRLQIVYEWSALDGGIDSCVSFSTQKKMVKLIKESYLKAHIYKFQKKTNNICKAKKYWVHKNANVVHAVVKN